MAELLQNPSVTNQTQDHPRRQEAIDFVQNQMQQLDEWRFRARHSTHLAPDELQSFKERIEYENQQILDMKDQLINAGIVSNMGDFISASSESAPETIEPLAFIASMGAGPALTSLLMRGAGGAMRQGVLPTIGRAVDALSAQAGQHKGGEGIMGASIMEQVAQIPISRMPGGLWGKHMLRYIAEPLAVGAGAATGDALERLARGKDTSEERFITEGSKSLALPALTSTLKIAGTTLTTAARHSGGGGVIKEHHVANEMRQRMPRLFKAPGSEATAAAYHEMRNSGAVLPAYQFSNHISQYIDELNPDQRSLILRALNSTTPPLTVRKELPGVQAEKFGSRIFEEFKPKEGAVREIFRQRSVPFRSMPATNLNRNVVSEETRWTEEGLRRIQTIREEVTDPALFPRDMSIGELDAWRQHVRDAMRGTEDGGLQDLLYGLNDAITKHISRSLNDPNILRTNPNVKLSNREIAEKLAAAQLGHSLNVSENLATDLMYQPSITRYRDDIKGQILEINLGGLRSQLGIPSPEEIKAGVTLWRPQGKIATEFVERLKRINGGQEGLMSLMQTLEAAHIPIIKKELQREQGVVGSPMSWMARAILSGPGRRVLQEEIIKNAGYVTNRSATRIANEGRRGLDQMLRPGGDPEQEDASSSVFNFLKQYSPF